MTVMNRFIVLKSRYRSLIHRKSQRSKVMHKMFVSMTIACFLGGMTMAQEPTQAAQSTNPEIQKLNEEKQKADLERDIAKAKAETLKAYAEGMKAGLPSPETKALEGKISVSDTYALPCQIYAYNAVSEITKQAGSDISNAAPNVTTLVIYSEKELGSIGAYKSALTQIKTFQARYDPLLPQPVAAAAAAAAPLAALFAPEILSAFIGSVADVAAYFRTDVEIKAPAVAVDDVAVIAELARWLRESKSPIKKVIYPPIHLPRQFFINGANSSALIIELYKLYENHSRAGEQIAAFEAMPPEDQKKYPAKDNIPRLKSLNDQADKFMSSLALADEKTGLSMLTLLLKAEQLQLSLADEHTAIIYIKTDVAGGGNKTTRNLFAGTKLLHNGGSVITFILFADDGAILFSKAYWCATEFTKFKKDSVPRLLKNF